MRAMLEKAISDYGISIDPDKVEAMVRYWNCLKETNRIMNLTAVVSDEEAVIRHFIDSLAPVKHDLLQYKARVIDVGSGAGFPGMPLKIARPDLDVTLLDSLDKRVRFLRHASDIAGVSLSAIHARAEDAARTDMRESYDIAVARAVARLSVLAELCLPFVKVSGMFIAYKGAAARDELEEAAKSITLSGGGRAQIISSDLPQRDNCMIVIRKLSHTSDRFPRKAGEAARNPII